MDVKKKYFNNISERERTIFEGAITMGALFHQFIGTPVNIESVTNLEKSIKTAMELQPCIEEVNVHIDRKILAQSSDFDYLSLSGEMLTVEVISKFKDKKAVIVMEYIKALNYPLMYVKDATE